MKSRKNRSSVSGMPVEIQNPRVRRAIQTVIRGICRHPRDWARVRRRVQSIRYLTTEDGETDGEWLTDPEAAQRLKKRQSANPRLWYLGDVHFQVPGWIEISREVTGLPWIRLVAIIAHELGHAMTRESEFYKRSSVNSEWAIELCADRYAFRWGFERHIRVHAPFRLFAHHAGLPGQKIFVGDQAFKVDRNFFLRPDSSPGGKEVTK